MLETCVFLPTGHHFTMLSGRLSRTKDAFPSTDTTGGVTGTRILGFCSGSSARFLVCFFFFFLPSRSLIVIKDPRMFSLVRRAAGSTWTCKQIILLVSSVHGMFVRKLRTQRTACLSMQRFHSWRSSAICCCSFRWKCDPELLIVGVTMRWKSPLVLSSMTFGWSITTASTMKRRLMLAQVLNSA